MVALSLAIWSSPALAQRYWQPVENEPAVQLPDPAGNDAIASAKMSCAEQKWTLSLVARPDAVIAATTGDGGSLTIDGENFAAPVRRVDAGVDLAVPDEAIEPMKAGWRFSVAFSNDQPAVDFSLGGSRRSLTAAEEICSPRTVPGFDKVVTSPYSSHLQLARELRSEAIDEFAIATASQPSVSAGMVDLDGGKRLLFIELCGSYWYFGDSGCNLSGYAQVSTGGDWQPAYDTEGAFLYVDPDNETDGWPNLVSLPLKSGYEETKWRWAGDGYETVGDSPNFADGDELRRQISP